jgi:hypothetical protein
MDIITFINVDRFKWAGHAVRMDQQNNLQKEFIMPNQKEDEEEEDLK